MVFLRGQSPIGIHCLMLVTGWLHIILVVIQIYSLLDTFQWKVVFVSIVNLLKVYYDFD